MTLLLEVEGVPPVKFVSATNCPCVGLPPDAMATVWLAIVTDCPPMATLVAPARLVPVSVTLVPPVTGPLPGDTLVMVGGGK